MRQASTSVSCHVLRQRPFAAAGRRPERRTPAPRCALAKDAQALEFTDDKYKTFTNTAGLFLWLLSLHHTRTCRITLTCQLLARWPERRRSTVGTRAGRVLLPVADGVWAADRPFTWNKIDVGWCAAPLPQLAEQALRRRAANARRRGPRRRPHGGAAPAGRQPAGPQPGGRWTARWRRRWHAWAPCGTSSRQTMSTSLMQRRCAHLRLPTSPQRGCGGAGCPCVTTAQTHGSDCHRARRGTSQAPASLDTTRSADPLREAPGGRAARPP